MGCVREWIRSGSRSFGFGFVQLSPSSVPGSVFAGLSKVRDDDTVTQRHRHKGDGRIEAEVYVNELILLKVLPRITNGVAAVLSFDFASRHPQAAGAVSSGCLAASTDTDINLRRILHGLRHEAVGDEIMGLETTQQGEDDGEAVQCSPHGEPPSRVEGLDNAKKSLHRYGDENPGGEIQRGVEDEQVNLAADVGEYTDVVVEGMNDPVTHGAHGEDDAVRDG